MQIGLRMRLAVISDIHGNLAALEAVLADIARRGHDEVVNLGDCCTAPLWPRETFVRLDGLRLRTVRGNHDRWLAQRSRETLSPAAQFTFDALDATQRRALGALPTSLDLGENVLAVHGTPDNDSEYLTEHVHDGRLIPASRPTVSARLGAAATCSLILCGHSHRQFVLQMPHGPLILNPGSVGCPLFADSPSATTLEPRSPHARYATVTKRSAGRWDVELHVLTYDWDAAARRARDNGREDWAQALASGNVQSPTIGASS